VITAAIAKFAVSLMSRANLAGSVVSDMFVVIMYQSSHHEMMPKELRPRKHVPEQNLGPNDYSSPDPF
jgi:hypothetical protein